MAIGLPVDAVINVQEPTDVATARREAVQVARMAGLGEVQTESVRIVVTEAATNLIKHGGGGSIVARIPGSWDRSVVEIIAIDRGKGMVDPMRCFEDGYSTAGTCGTGLGSIARQSFFHHIYSVPGQGTVLIARVGKTAGSQGQAEWAALSFPYPGEDICGDAWRVEASAERLRLTIADGLGHGRSASEASEAAVEMVQDAFTPAPTELLEMMHGRLRSTRGAATAIADVDFEAEMVTFAGVGNIAGCVLSDSGLRRQMVSMNGTVGHEMRKVREYTYPFPSDSLVILHSDGLTTHWAFDKYPGLGTQDPTVIAAVLMRDFRRSRDDATILVGRKRAARP
jgi:anti-sigma regulatory factor (Ser/Thr protein kinase)